MEIVKMFARANFAHKTHASLIKSSYFFVRLILKQQTIALCAQHFFKVEENCDLRKSRCFSIEIDVKSYCNKTFIQFKFAIIILFCISNT